MVLTYIMVLANGVVLVHVMVLSHVMVLAHFIMLAHVLVLAPVMVLSRVCGSLCYVTFAWVTRPQRTIFIKSSFFICQTDEPPGVC